MRVGLVRSDLQRIYLADIENSSQRNYSSEPAGQSRYFSKPSDAQLESVLDGYAFLSALGSNSAATVDTTGGNNILKVKAASASSYTTITLTSNAALAKATVVSQINTQLSAASLPLFARLSGNNVVIDTTGSNSGPGAYISFDANVSSTANTVLGFTAGALTGLSVSALKTAIYPTATSVDVSSSTVLALSTFTNLAAAAKSALVEALADLVAPRLVETGSVLLSYVHGNLSKLSSSSFQPGGDRGGLTAGAAVSVVSDDGVTPFTI